MKSIVLFEMPTTLAFQKVLFCFCIINSFWFICKNVLILGNFMPIINTFLFINQKLFIVEKQKSVFWKARVMGFSKSTIAFI